MPEYTPADNPVDLLVTTDAGLAEYCAHLRTLPFCAMDVEFVWRKTYFPAVALIQACGSDGRVALIDPLAIEDPSPLAELLDDESVIKILHSGSQDLMVFQQYVGTMPRPLMDTQIVAAMVGLGYSMGYAALVEKAMGVTLPKGAQTSDWLRRPLSAGQLAYGANEVSHLVEVWRWLEAELEARGRYDWAAADSAATLDAVLYEKPPHASVSGAGRLGPRQLTALNHLAIWRDEWARSSDRPVRWMVEDTILMDIATAMPTTRQELNVLRLPERLVERHADVMLAAVEAAHAAPEAELQRPVTRRKPTPAERKRADALLARIRAHATANDLPPELVAPRRVVEALAFNPEDRDSPLLQGWRGDLFADQIIPVLSGPLDSED